MWEVDIWVRVSCPQVSWSYSFGSWWVLILFLNKPGPTSGQVQTVPSRVVYAAAEMEPCLLHWVSGAELLHGSLVMMAGLGDGRGAIWIFSWIPFRTVWWILHICYLLPMLFGRQMESSEPPHHDLKSDAKTRGQTQRTHRRNLFFWTKETGTFFCGWKSGSKCNSNWENPSGRKHMFKKKYFLCLFFMWNGIHSTMLCATRSRERRGSSTSL